MVLNLDEQTLMEIRAAVLDEDGREALRLLKLLIKQIEQQKNAGMKSHIDP